MLIGFTIYYSTLHTRFNCYYCINNSWLSSKGIEAQTLHTLIEGAISVMSIDMVYNICWLSRASQNGLILIPRNHLE